MLHEQAQIGLKGCQRLHGVGRSGSGSAKPSDPPFLFRDDLLCVPHATLGQSERIVIRHELLVVVISSLAAVEIHECACCSQTTGL
jgi:hypothetical protein